MDDLGCCVDGEEMKGTEILEVDVGGRLQSRVKERPVRQWEEGAGSGCQFLSPKRATALSGAR